MRVILTLFCLCVVVLSCLHVGLALAVHAPLAALFYSGLVIGAAWVAGKV